MYLCCSVCLLDRFELTATGHAFLWFEHCGWSDLLHFMRHDRGWQQGETIWYFDTTNVTWKRTERNGTKLHIHLWAEQHGNALRDSHDGETACHYPNKDITGSKTASHAKCKHCKVGLRVVKSAYYCTKLNTPNWLSPRQIKWSIL